MDGGGRNGGGNQVTLTGVSTVTYSAYNHRIYEINVFCSLYGGHFGPLSPKCLKNY